MNGVFATNSVEAGYATPEVKKYEIGYRNFENLYRMFMHFPELFDKISYHSLACLSQFKQAVLGIR